MSRVKTFPEVKLVDFRKGWIVFKKPACSELMTIDSSKKILTLFRKIDADLQTTCIQSLQSSFDIKEAIAQRCLKIFF